MRNALLLELVLIFAGVALPIIGGILAAFLKRKWGIEIEAKHREALHSALDTAAWAVRSEYGISASQGIPEGAVQKVLSYANKSVPEAMAKLHPGPQVAAELATAALQRVLSQR